MLSYQDAEMAIIYLAETADEYARLKGVYDHLCEQKKTIAALEYGKLDGSAAEKNQKALASEAYIEHINKMRDAQIEFELIRQKRLTNSTVIDVWRSLNKSYTSST